MILTFTLFAVIAYCFAIIRNSEHPFAWAAGVGCVALVLALTDSENKENTKYRNKLLVQHKVDNQVSMSKKL